MLYLVIICLYNQHALFIYGFYLCLNYGVADSVLEFVGMEIVYHFAFLLGILMMVSVPYWDLLSFVWIGYLALIIKILFEIFISN